MLNEVLGDYSQKAALVSTIILGFLIATVLVLQAHKVKFNKTLFFSLMAIVIILPTLFFIGSTIYINTISSSKGPVHWHADFEVWACGKEFNLRDPKGLSNKIGTPTLHEHNDKRVHLEGVVVEEGDASLGNFFKVIGGGLTSESFSVPTNEGLVSYTNGNACDDGTYGTVQVFRYRTSDGKYTQEKLTDPASVIMAPDSAVPPGDCFIVEFGPEKERTDKLCRSYKVAEKLKKVVNSDPSL